MWNFSPLTPYYLEIMRPSVFAILLLSGTFGFPQSVAPNIAGDWILVVERQGERVIAAKLPKTTLAQLPPRRQH